MKNVFYFILKFHFVHETFTLFIYITLFGYVEKRLVEKAMVNFKIYDVTDCTTNDGITQITQYLRK